MRPVIVGAAEGEVDAAAIRRLVDHAGGQPGPVHGKRGKAYLRRNIAGYNNAARHASWVVLVDLDHDAECAPPLRRDWLPRAAAGMCFRVAVREVEAWLLADRERFARMLSVAVSLIPRAPETLEDPKRAVVNLARRSRRRAIREDMVPRPRSGRAVGPAYASRLIEFTEDRRQGWRPERAAAAADSLRRCIGCLRSLVQAATSEG